jgi:hypothetical protein
LALNKKQSRNMEIIFYQINEVKVKELTTEGVKKATRNLKK